MNKDKYVIANCPAYRDKACLNHSSISYCYMEFDQCQDCSDCVLKQIVEYCLNQNLKYDTTACDILDILDILEVDNDA